MLMLATELQMLKQSNSQIGDAASCKLQAASAYRRRDFWRKIYTPLWLLIGRIIFLTSEKTSFAILIGRIVFLTYKKYRSRFGWARTHLRVKIYDILAFSEYISVFI